MYEYIIRAIELNLLQSKLCFFRDKQRKKRELAEDVTPCVHFPNLFGSRMVRDK
jgi:hypothetical protein